MGRLVSRETAEEIVIELHATQLLPACSLLSSLFRLKPMSLTKLWSKAKNPGQTEDQNWRKVGVGRLDASGLSTL